MFEKILELLVALVVAVAGTAGINTAAEHADPSANDAALGGAAALAEERAELKAASGISRAEEARSEQASVGPADGLARALEALSQAAENAPEAADDGLDRATEAITESPANDAPAGPPDELPVGRP